MFEVIRTAKKTQESKEKLTILLFNVSEKKKISLPVFVSFLGEITPKVNVWVLHEHIKKSATKRKMWKIKCIFPQLCNATQFEIHFNLYYHLNIKNDENFT